MNVKPILVTNNRGVKFCYLPSIVSTSGGGTYLSRVLAARNETKADVFVLMLPTNPQSNKNAARIKRGRDDLMSAVKPLILPFKIVVTIGATQTSLEDFFRNMDWSDIKY